MAIDPIKQKLIDLEVRVIFIEENMVTKDYLENKLMDLKNGIYDRLDFIIKQMFDMRQESIAMNHRLDNHDVRLTKAEKNIKNIKKLKSN